MKDLKLEVERHDDSQQLTAEIELEAPLDAVWKALTEAEEITRWFSLQAETTPGVGGSLDLSWDGQWESSLEIRKWEPNRHLQVSWPWVPEENAPNEQRNDARSPVLVDYWIEAQSGGGTTLRLVHSGFPVGDDWDDIFDGTRRGWSYELQSLKQYLEHHLGKNRRVARLNRPMGEHSESDVWERLWSAEGMALEIGDEKGNGRTTYEATLPGGLRLSGRVLVSIPPTDFGGTVDGVENSLFRAAIGHECEGDDGREVQLWLATWGSLEREVAAIEAAWQQVLDRVL